MKRDEETKSPKDEEVTEERVSLNDAKPSSVQSWNNLQLLEKTFASLGEAVFVIDAKTTRILNCNPAASQMFGYSKEEMLGQKSNFLHVDEERLRDFRKRLFSAVEERGCLDLPEFQMKRKNGEVFYTSHSVRPLENDQGERIGWVSIVRDITYRRRADELLIKNEDRLKRAQEIAHLGSWELDLFNNCLIWSDEVYRIFGLQPQQFGAIYEAFLEAVHPDDRTAVDAAYSGSLREGRDTYEIEHRIVRKETGEIRYVHEKCEHVRDETGKIIRSEGMVHDITERKRMEEELRRSRDELEQRVQDRTRELKRQAELLNLTHDAIIIREMDGVISFWNKGAEGMYGWTKEEALGKILRDLLQTQFPIPRDEIIAKFMQEGRWEGELSHTRKDGKMIKAFCTWTLQRDEEGKPAGVMVICHDITERLKLEEQLRQAQKMEALGTLAGGIAHDFNNLLNAILINLEMAVMDIKAWELPQLEYMETAMASANRGKQLVEQIITFSRHRGEALKPVKIAPIVREAIKFLKSAIPVTVRFETRIEDPSPMVMANPAQIHQVLMNLCNNAAHSMQDHGGVLEISLEKVEREKSDEMSAGNYLCLKVKDTGCGMTPEVREKAFDPFFTTKEKGKGAGMGLAVVHGIVKKHGGEIRLESELGKGTTVSVFLPVIEPPEKEEVPSSALGPLTGTETILLIDDEEVQIRSIELMLKRLGYQVFAETDPRKALERFRSQPDAFDLVITDQVMPFLPGIELSQEMRAIRPNLPIILCTGYSEKVDEENVGSFGIKGYIQKPFNINEISSLIRRALSKKIGPSGSDSKLD